MSLQRLHKGTIVKIALDYSTRTGPQFALFTAVTCTLVGFRSLYDIYPRVVHASTSTPEGKASDKIDEGVVFLFEQNKKRRTAVISRCGIYLGTGTPTGQLSVRS